jgi:hypothetical protein
MIDEVVIEHNDNWHLHIYSVLTIEFLYNITTQKSKRDECTVSQKELEGKLIECVICPNNS